MVVFMFLYRIILFIVFIFAVIFIYLAVVKGRDVAMDFLHSIVNSMKLKNKNKIKEENQKELEEKGFVLYKE